MNLTTFKTKLLLFLSASNREEGKISKADIAIIITFILLGIVVIAIALPSFFISQGTPNKRSEGKFFVGATVRAQQAYRLEATQFAPTFTDLKIGLPTQTANFVFRITSADKESTTVEAISLKPELKSFAGKVINDTTGTKAMNCQTTAPSYITPIPDPATQTCKTGEPMNEP